MSTRSSGLANLFLLVASVLCSIALLEYIARNLSVSSAWGVGIQAENWSATYWHPINSLGIRDYEPGFAAGGKSVVVVGDSFTEGHGVAFSETAVSELRRLLSAANQNYQVINLGLSGTDSGSQYNNLLKLPVPPEILILQYFGNDIEGAAIRNGFGQSTDSLELIAESYKIPRMIFAAVDSTAIGQMIVRPFLITRASQQYYSYFTSAYANDIVFREHLGELGRFAEYCRMHRCAFFATIYPYLEDQPEAAKLNSIFIPKVRDALVKAGAKFIDIDELSLSLSPKERMVNRSDGHPSPKLHRLVAKALYRGVFSGTQMSAQ